MYTCARFEGAKHAVRGHLSAFHECGFQFLSSLFARSARTVRCPSIPVTRSHDCGTVTFELCIRPDTATSEYYPVIRTDASPAGSPQIKLIQSACRPADCYSALDLTFARRKHRAPGYQAFLLKWYIYDPFWKIVSRETNISVDIFLAAGIIWNCLSLIVVMQIIQLYVIPILLDI